MQKLKIIKIVYGTYSRNYKISLLLDTYEKLSVMKTARTEKR